MSLSDGLIGHWSATLQPVKSGPLDDFAGTNTGNLINLAAWEFNDEGNGTYGISVGAQGWITHVNVLSPIGLAMSFSLWFRWNEGQSGTNKGIAATHDTPFVFLMWYTLSNEIGFRIFDTSDNPHEGSAPFPGRGSWHHYCGVWDGANVIMYIDGVAGSTVGNFSGPAKAPTTQLLQQASYSSQSATGSYGLWDTARQYNRALTPSEVSQLFAGGRAEDFEPPPTDFQPAWAAQSNLTLQSFAS